MNTVALSMTIKEVADTLIAWTASCTTQAQLELINDCIDRFLVVRFKGDLGIAHQVSRVMIVLQRKSADLVEI